MTEKGRLRFSNGNENGLTTKQRNLSIGSASCEAFHVKQFMWTSSPPFGLESLIGLLFLSLSLEGRGRG
jgi:hypothetical protein